jgi:hypothetical protein
MHKSFLIFDFVNNSRKMALSWQAIYVHAVAERDERDVEGKEQSCW